MVSFEMFLQKDHKPSMYGKIRLVLKRYMRNIYIFGFNSSKFDSVFLYNKLIPFIVNKHFQVSVAKKNQSISNLMITKPPHIWIYPKKGHGYVLKKILGKGILFNSIIGYYSSAEAKLFDRAACVFSTFIGSPGYLFKNPYAEMGARGWGKSKAQIFGSVLTRTIWNTQCNISMKRTPFRSKLTFPILI